MSNGQEDLFDWAQRPRIRTYLRRTGKRRRGCHIFERNPDWDGRLMTRAEARHDDPSESHDAAESVQDVDIYEVKKYADIILERGQGVISTEIREFVLAGIAAGEIDSHGKLPDVRAESIRRRFHDLYKPF